jgi:hypothetical protein
LQGLRRVRNFLTASESIAPWAVAGVVPPAQVAASAGGETYAGVTFPIGGNAFAYSNAVINAGQVATNLNLQTRVAGRIKLFLSRPLAGVESLTIYVEWNGDTGQGLTLTATNTVNLTNPTVMGFGGGLSNGITGAAAVNLRVYISAGGQLNTPISIYAKYWQVEDVMSQAIQTAAEYVSVGVKSAPIYHGAGVDGVRYFPWLNGNTVSGTNVLTENVGATISAATRLGYLPENTRVNLLLRSDNFSATWTLNQVTVSPDIIAAPDGVIRADRIHDTAINTNHEIIQSVAKAAVSLDYTVSVYAKFIAQASLYLELANAASTGGIGCTFNIQTGVPGAVAPFGVGFTAGVVTMTALPNGWYRCTVKANSDADVVIKTTMRATSGGFLGTGAAMYYLTDVQLEQELYATSPILTTVAAAQRDGDNLSYVKDYKWFNAVNGTWYFNYTARDNGASQLQRRYLVYGNDTGNNRNAVRQCDVTVQNFPMGIYGNGAINVTSDSPVPQTAGVTNKWASRFTAGESRSALNGALGAAQATGYVDANSFATIGLGWNTVDPSLGQPNTPIAETRLYPYGLTDSQLQLLTT